MVQAARSGMLFGKWIEMSRIECSSIQIQIGIEIDFSAFKSVHISTPIDWISRRQAGGYLRLLIGNGFLKYPATLQ